MKRCVIMEVKGARQRGRPGKTWKEVVNMNDLHLKLSDAMDHGGEREMVMGNWRDSISDAEYESYISGA